MLSHFKITVWSIGFSLLVPILCLGQDIHGFFESSIPIENRSIDSAYYYLNIESNQEKAAIIIKRLEKRNHPKIKPYLLHYLKAHYFTVMYKNDSSLFYFEKAIESNNEDEIVLLNSKAFLSTITPYLEASKLSDILISHQKLDSIYRSKYDCSISYTLYTYAYINLVRLYGVNKELIPLLQKTLTCSEQSDRQEFIFRTHGLIASTYAPSGNLREAISHFNKAIEIYETKIIVRNPSSIYFHFSTIYRNIKIYKKAIELLDKAIEFEKVNMKKTNMYYFIRQKILNLYDSKLNKDLGHTIKEIIPFSQEQNRLSFMVLYHEISGKNDSTKYYVDKVFAHPKSDDYDKLIILPIKYKFESFPLDKYNIDELLYFKNLAENINDFDNADKINDVLMQHYILSNDAKNTLTTQNYKINYSKLHLISD